jgi:Rieske Fe-S protein
MDNQLSRRQLIRDAALTGTVVAAGLGAAACSSPSNTGSGSSGSGSGSGSGATSAGGGSGSGGGGSANALAKTSDIPVGGGAIFADQKVVVTQPTAGTFKGFSTTCTHLGCQVDKVANGLIQCPCHGSRYSVVDGSVKAGPAPKPLPPQKITVTGNEITLG